ncbi:MAG: hypothetical protein Q9190_003616 [Brigantiaea leucoxantha]
MAAALFMLDDQYKAPQNQDPNDPNYYNFGRIGNHNIVIACLNETGTVSAATLANQMLRSFPSIKLGLMVGIGGGVPTQEDGDIRLGDVVVSKPDNTFGGVVQYDIGKKTPEGVFERTGSLDKPPLVLRNALSGLQTEEKMKRLKIDEIIHGALQKSVEWNEYSRPDEKDELYRADYNHVGPSRECKGCDPTKIIDRPKRKGPKIHYGTIASGNSVIKDAVFRDKLSKDLGGIKCFDMEAAGLLGHFPCLVIRGICDYADSHKNDMWHNYAAITAAAFAKKLLTIMPTREVEITVTVQKRVSFYEQYLATTGRLLVQHLVSHSNHYLLESQLASSQQEACPRDQFLCGFRQSSGQQEAGTFDRLPLGYGQPTEQERGTPSNQSSPGVGGPYAQDRTSPPYSSLSSLDQPSGQSRTVPFHNQLPAQQRPLSSNKSPPGFNQPSAQQRASPFHQVRPGIGRPSAHPSPSLYRQSNQGGSSTHPQWSLTPNRIGYDRSDPMQAEGYRKDPGGVRKTAVESQPARSVGYRQPPGMVYTQAAGKP